VPHRIEYQDTYSIVMDKVPQGRTYCALCSRLRRGNLYRVAREEGCSAVVLGHHRDDILETFFMNLFHGAPTGTEFRKLRKRIVRQVREAIEQYAMIEPGGKWLVCLSGGKDSYTLLAVLHELKCAGCCRSSFWPAISIRASPAFRPRCSRSFSTAWACRTGSSTRTRIPW